MGVFWLAFERGQHPLRPCITNITLLSFRFGLLLLAHAPCILSDDVISFFLAAVLKETTDSNRWNLTASPRASVDQQIQMSGDLRHNQLGP